MSDYRKDDPEIRGTYQFMHDDLGCHDCIFRDRGRLNNGPCCTIEYRMDDVEGVCLDKTTEAF